jgi:hypothetical protein
MRNYIVTVNGEGWQIKATSARVAIDKVLRSVVGTRTADKKIPLHITVNTDESVRELGNEQM